MPGRGFESGSGCVRTWNGRVPASNTASARGGRQRETSLAQSVSIRAVRSGGIGFDGSARTQRMAKSPARFGDSGRLLFWDTLAQDVRFACRLFVRSPLLTAAQAA